MVGMFADGYNAVVAGGAVVHDTRMIKHAGGKCRGAMAVGAIVGGGNMVHRFSDRRHSVMAGGAVIHDARMTEHGV